MVKKRVGGFDVFVAAGLGSDDTKTSLHAGMYVHGTRKWVASAAGRRPEVSMLGTSYHSDSSRSHPSNTVDRLSRSVSTYVLEAAI